MKLIAKADVVIDPFRPGVLERLGLSPEAIDKASNGRTILARLTGFPRTGPWSDRAGHDINYLALSGVLSLFKPPESPTPVPPINLLADFAGGSLICVVGILLALLERLKSGKGQVVEADMVNGTRYLASFALLNSLPASGSPYFSKPVGQNVLDGGSPFYTTYACADGKFISVGALEPQFFAIFADIMVTSVPLSSDFKNLSMKTVQGDPRQWPLLKKYLSQAFLSKQRDEWTALFEHTDSCVAPILSLEESTNLWTKTSSTSDSSPSSRMPVVAPRLTRTPGKENLAVLYSSQSMVLQPGAHTSEILNHMGYSSKESEALFKTGVVEQSNIVSRASKL